MQLLALADNDLPLKSALDGIDKHNWPNPGIFARRLGVRSDGLSTDTCTDWPHDCRGGFWIPLSDQNTYSGVLRVLSCSGVLRTFIGLMTTYFALTGLFVLGYVLFC